MGALNRIFSRNGNNEISSRQKLQSWNFKLNTRPIDEKTKIDLSWRLLNASVKYQPATACVKHYLSNHIRTRFLKINFSDWITAAMLPVENFKNAKKEKVWQDTKQKYGY
jgi:hypothetical protein